jgi:hypothetical protein
MSDQETSDAPSDEVRLCACGAKVMKNHHVCRSCYMVALGKINADGAHNPDLRIPEAWHDLPESTDPKPDMLWAWNNVIHVVKIPGKSDKIWWGRMTTPPTRASFDFILFYDSNPTAFRQELRKYLGNQDATDPELVTEEKRSIAEVRKVLEAFKAKEA